MVRVKLGWVEDKEVDEMESVQLYPTPSGGGGVTLHWSITVEPRGYGPSGGSVVMVTS